MNTSLFAQPEVYKNKASLPIQIPKEHLEQWFVQSLKVEAVGAGSYPIDILKANEWGADVNMLSCKVDKNDNLTSGDSGETSLAQKFVGTGISLDDMFNQEQYQKKSMSSHCQKCMRQNYLPIISHTYIPLLAQSLHT